MSAIQGTGDHQDGTDITSVFPGSGGFPIHITEPEVHHAGDAPPLS
jgi:hypothetical protein